MPQHGKKYLEVAKMVDPLKFYQPAEAIDLIKKTSYAKFDATVEVHMRLGVDPRHADQMVRGVAILPAGTGKTVRVLVFAQGDKAREAEEAGADFVGSDDLIKRIEDGWLGFDTAIATPDMMGKVSRLGRILGPRGLMPNPRTGTVSFELERVIKEVKAGRVEFRVERTVGVIHAPVGKVSFTDEQLRTNLAAFMDAIVKARPSGAKGAYVRSINLSSTMGPGLKLDVQPTLALADSAA